MPSRVRRLYSRTAARLLLGGDWRRLLRVLAKTARAARALRAGRVPPAPILATVFVTFRCNHDCFMCETLATDARLRKDARAEPDTAGMKRILDACGDLGVAALSFTGGEPLLRRDLGELVAHARGLGLLTHLNTNGFLLDETRSRELVSAGIDSVNLSLDADTAGLHDRLRRAPGSFDRVKGALEHLRSAGRLMGRKPLVTLVTALGSHNAGAASRIAKLARAWGADGVGFLPLHRFDVNGGLRLLPEEGEADSSPLREVLARLKGDTSVDNTAGYLDLFERCLRGEPFPHRCLAGYLSVTVDCFGNRYRCFPYGLWGIPDASLAGARNLAEAWRSGSYGDLRRRMETCGSCYWNCHTEMGLLLGGR